MAFHFDAFRRDHDRERDPEAEEKARVARRREREYAHYNALPRGSRWDDQQRLEKTVANFADAYFWDVQRAQNYCFERPTDHDRQIAGIDLRLYNCDTGAQVESIDEKVKAWDGVLNAKVKWLGFELLHPPGRDSHDITPGWLIGDYTRTDGYIYYSVFSSVDDVWDVDVTNITELYALHIGKRSVLDYAASRGLDKKGLTDLAWALVRDPSTQARAERDRRRPGKLRLVVAPDLWLTWSTDKAETPCNLVIPRQSLLDSGAADEYRIAPDCAIAPAGGTIVGAVEVIDATPKKQDIAKEQDMSVTGYTVEDGYLMAGKEPPQPKAQPKRPPQKHETRLSAQAAWEHHEAEAYHAYLASQGVQ